MTTTRFALALFLSLFCLHCTAEAGGPEQDQSEAVEPAAVESTGSALTTGATGGETAPETTDETAEKGKKKKQQQDFLIVKLHDILISS
ncbi:MAG: hypothetical protein JST00_29390 [Deltaproteobacteria bacterium]|nr:hypothetical protein [Deltaproteobacteria bacterium]